MVLEDLFVICSRFWLREKERGVDMFSKAEFPTKDIASLTFS